MFELGVTDMTATTEYYAVAYACTDADDTLDDTTLASDSDCSWWYIEADSDATDVTVSEASGVLDAAISAETYTANTADCTITGATADCSWDAAADYDLENEDTEQFWASTETAANVFADLVWETLDNCEDEDSALGLGVSALAASFVF